MNVRKSIRRLMCAGMALVLGLACAPVIVKADTLLYYDGVAHRYNAQPISLTINGKTLTNLTVPPILLNEYTMVPARDVFEELGAVVDWKAADQEIYIGYQDALIILQINNKYANVNGKYMEMDVPPKIINDKTMIPVRFPSESLGFEVNWEGDARTVHISTAQLPLLDPIMGGVGTETALPDLQPSLPASENTALPNIGQESKQTTNGENSLTDLSSPAQSATELAKDVSPADIKTESHPDTKLTNLSLPNASEGFSIRAASAISRVDKMLLPDNRLVLDIYNAENTLQSEYSLAGNAVVAKVRTAQNQITPVKITRVVFDLTTPVNYTIQLSQDRKTILVSFEKNTVYDIRFTSDSTNDYLTIDCEKKPGVNVFPLTSPDRVVIDLPLTTMKKLMDERVDGHFSASVRTGQFDESTGRVTIDLKEMATYDVTYAGNRVILKLSPVTYKNIAYDGAEKIIKIKKTAGFPIQLQAVEQNDQYNALQYTFTLPGDFSNHLGYGEIVVKGGYLNSILIQNNTANRTEIVIRESRILAYSLTEDSQYYYIKAMLPKEKYPRIVVVDAGHGGADPGAGANSMQEKNLTFDMAMRLVKLLEQDGSIKVYATRTSDVKPSRPERAAFGNEVGDMFVSIHINSGADNTAANGTEVYYYPHANDPTLGFTSEQLASIMQKQLLASLGSNDRKVKKYGWDVLTLTDIPAVLCEIGFITNPEEAAKLATETYRQKTAEAIYNGLQEAFQKYTPRR